MNKIELMPHDGRKSFYKKAYVEIHDDNTSVLLSYGTRIIERRPDGSLKKLWHGWSATTGRHIAAFCGLNKRQYEALN